MLHYQTIDISSKETKTISFYTSDESTEYMIIVEGIRNDGQIERVELPLIVQVCVSVTLPLKTKDPLSPVQ